MAQSNNYNPEDKALDALMAAAFRLGEADKSISADEAEELVDNPPAFSPEDEVVLASLDSAFVENLVCSEEKTPHISESSEVIDQELEEVCGAMNRGPGEQNLSDETLREIERKRRELLGEAEQNSDKNEDRPDGC